MSDALEKFTPKEIIRTETALSRFPIHRLSKKGSISIEIRVTKPNGELKTKWEVDSSLKYGQPSQLAYKLDTLITNRRIEEAGKPLPKLIKLGSLPDIAAELGLVDSGTNLNHIKKALLQNAFAGVLTTIAGKLRLRITLL